MSFKCVNTLHAWILSGFLSAFLVENAKTYYHYRHITQVFSFLNSLFNSGKKTLVNTTIPFYCVMVVLLYADDTLLSDRQIRNRVTFYINRYTTRADFLELNASECKYMKRCLCPLVSSVAIFPMLQWKE